MGRKDVVKAVLISLVLLVGTLPGGVLAAPSAQSGNLLNNGNFDGSYSNGVASGWAPWHEDSGDLCSKKPEDWNFACKPGWGQEMDPNGYGLTRGGYSQHVGAQYLPWHGGVFQTVSVAPGTPVRFSVWGYSWASQENLPSSSAGDRLPRMRVGIDPQGNGTWHNAGIVWSGEVNTLDGWVQLSVETTAGSNGKVTVFVSSNYRGITPLKHMDTWWDDAVLEAVAPAATATPVPPPAAPTNTPGPPPPPAATSTPRPDGAIVHVVEAGDTLFGIAIQYDVPVEQIEQLNASSLGPNNMIYVGQELVIEIPSTLPTATPAPATEVTAEPEPPPAETTAPESSGGGSVCVLAYHDRSGDTFRQPDTEELLPNAVFSLGDATSLLGQYTTDGISEPYCFSGLAPGTYRVTMQAPPGYTPSGPSEITLTLGADGRLDVAFGAQRSEGGEGAEATETPEEGEQGESGTQEILPQILRWAARISGILVLLLAVAIGVVFVLSRRR